jgi:hypothetical protein
VQTLLRSGANPLQEYNGVTLVQKARKEYEYIEGQKNLLNLSQVESQAHEADHKILLLLLEANAAERKAAQEYLPVLGKDAKSHFARLPAEIRALVGNYFEW